MQQMNSLSFGTPMMLHKQSTEEKDAFCIGRTLKAIHPNVLLHVFSVFVYSAPAAACSCVADFNVKECIMV